MNYLDGLTKRGVDYELRDSRIVPDLDNVDNIIYSNFETEEIANKAIASFDDGADTVPVKELKVGIEAQQDLHGQASPWPDGGYVNKLKPYTRAQMKIANTGGTWSGDNYTVNGVTFACAFDNQEYLTTVTPSGTASSQALIWISTTQSGFVGDYKLSGGIASMKYITAQKNGNWIGVFSAGNDVSITGLVSTDLLRVCCVVEQNQTGTSIFKPMLREASVTDSTWYPYSNICPIYSQAEKNILPFDLDTIKSLNTSGTWSGNAYTYRTVVCTVKEDGELEISGTATGGDFDIIYGEVELSAVPYILSSGALVGNASYLQLLATGISDINTKSGEKTFTPPAVTATARVHINSGTTVNAVCQPMVRNAANPDPTFVPYRCVARVDEYGKNLFDKTTATATKILNRDTGGLNQNNGYTTSDFIKVKESDTLTFTGFNTYYACWYDINRNYISAIASGIVPTGAAYVRASLLTANIDTAQIEVGTEATPYEAFKDRTYFSLAKNMWDEEWELGAIYANSGEDAASTIKIRSVGYTKCEAGISYYFQHNSTEADVFFYGADKQYLGYDVHKIVNTSGAFVVPSGAEYLRFSILQTTYNNDIAILNAPPEIYGAELNVTTGELTVTHGMTDLGDRDWWKASNTPHFYTSSFTPQPRFYDNSTATGIKCEAFVKASYDDVVGHVVDNSIGVSSQNRLVVYSSALIGQDVAAFKTAVTGIKAAYELTTPEIYHLDPVEVRTWLKENNITANTGNIIKLDYRVSPQITKSRELTELNQKILAVYPQDTASGSIASFPDGAEGVPVKELTAEIEPIQDLHGQPFPYPAGGYKNKLDTSTFTTETIYGVTFTQNSDGSIRVKGVATGNARKYITINLSLSSASYTLGYWVGTKRPSGANAAIVDTVSGTACIVNANTSSTTEALSGAFNQFAIYVPNGADIDATFYPMLSAGAATTYEPYSNICPISGYTGAEITVDGNNLLNDTIRYYSSGNIFIGNTDTSFHTPSVTLPAGTYTIRVSASAVANIYANDTDTNTAIAGFPAYGVNVRTFTISKTTSIAFRIYSVAYTSLANFNWAVLVKGSTDPQDYIPYNGTVYSVSWSDHGTVYKGTAQYKGGGEWEITPTYGKDDMGDLAWSRDSSGVFFAPLSTSKFGLCQLISSMYAFEPGNFLLTNYPTWPDNTVMRNANATYLYCKDTDYTDAPTFKTAVTGQSILYELATPVTFTVTGPDPETLLGDNNIWSDTGDISVKYRADIALYVNKKISEI